MNNEFNSGYQYDRCVSRGICSINPTTASLQEVIILYLKCVVFYGLKLDVDRRIVNLVLNTISILNSNYEISVKNFEMVCSTFQKELPRIIEKYEKQCSKKGEECEKQDCSSLLDKNMDINDYIRLGEKEFNKRVQEYSSEILNLNRLLFMLAKNVSINILTYESYGFKIEEEFSYVLKILNVLNSPENKNSELKELVIETAKKDCDLMAKIRAAQENLYGKQQEYDVSFSTTKGKAILVVGSNIRELEQILEEVKNTEIDIYTHDNMMLAHTFPKFKEYKNLKGQFGQGMESCLLDFSTFPGPIILTRNSLYNVENLYRGRLFTTDFAYSKGVIPIKNNDFSELIKTAENSRGFKTGKKCTSEKIGFSYYEALEKIDKKLSENNFEQIIIVGSRGYSKDEEEYFKILIKHVPNNILVISLSCCEEKQNIVCFNAEYDAFAMLKISKYVIEKASNRVSIFFPQIDKNTLSVLLILSLLDINKIFVGTWNQTILKPNILEELKTNFGILSISTPKRDLSLICNT